MLSHPVKLDGMGDSMQVDMVVEEEDEDLYTKLKTLQVDTNRSPGRRLCYEI